MCRTRDDQQGPCDAEGMQRFPGVCCGGVLDDMTRRSEHCGRDYLVQLKHWSKTLSAALFMLFKLDVDAMGRSLRISRQQEEEREAASALVGRGESRGSEEEAEHF